MDTRKLAAMRNNAMSLIGGLIVQYALGMYVNLFVAFPDNLSEGQRWAFAFSQVPLAAHIVLAFLLLSGAIALTVRAIFSKQRMWIIVAVVGLLAVIAALGGGAHFVISQWDGFSYIMSLSFLVALIAYGWGLVAASRSAQLSATV